ncbi:hypothetical protein BSAE_1900 [Bifidobacterium pullorum subsp. saeculare DSM 6531 = LMG 14934]|uniref:Uncharacterized protein n=1 Tax=Bifidobacterium pullorum subsp. saeculare DSM 6531 = LMG 14934 TaxID=1437611 RepID=A0A087CPX2_9BIFI|nr:hypothetical protein BSAE_1900 [Bifidobacterium pullorum subsp. saeculare DSM 6531 = LMG 14934]
MYGQKPSKIFPSEIIRPQLPVAHVLLKRVVLQHIGDLMSIMPELDVFNTRNK